MEKFRIQKKSRTICITGGHVTPALALIDEIRSTRGAWGLVFIGRKYALEGDWHVSEEYRLITERGIPFLHLTSGRLPRYPSVLSFLSLVKVPIGFLQSAMYLATTRPSVVMSFGGYIAFPVVLAAWLLGIPIITHEQTRHVGLTNRIIAGFSRRIFVSHTDTSRVFHPDKTVLSGLPVRQKILQGGTKPTFRVPDDKKLLYITGGITGAASLNQIVQPSIASLIQTYAVIHQTGHRTVELARAVRQQLPPNLRKYYIVKPYIDEDDLAWILRQARLVIGRSGANTAGEIAVCGKVAIFVPLPWSAAGEQRENAEALAQQGSSVVLDQTKLTPEKLSDTIHDVDRNFNSYEHHAQLIAARIPRHAARTIVHGIDAYVS